MSLKGSKLPKLSRLVYVVEVILYYMLEIKRMSGQSLLNRRSLVRLSCPSASQVPRRRAVDGYINYQDSSWPIITNNTPRDWSLITGRGGYKMGKLWVRNFLHPPSRQDKTFCAPPPFKVKLWWFWVYLVKWRQLCHLSWNSDVVLYVK